jgi:SNF2 family DNA or RNA helicase
MAHLIVPYNDFQYLPHQVEGITWMMRRESKQAPFCRGGILADEMGLGKTWETIGLLLNMPVANTLLIVPSVLQPQWEACLARSNIATRVLISTTKCGQGNWRMNKTPASRAGILVFITTYDRATRIVDDLNTVEFDRVICDEGHALKNGYRTNRFTQIARIDSTVRWVLTGTPVQNSIKNFTNLLSFISADAITDKHGATKACNEIILRRVLADVRADLPDLPPLPQHYVHPVSLPEGSEEKIVFDRLVSRFVDAIEAEMQQCVILELYLRIRQFTAYPQIYVDAMRRKYPDYPRKTWEFTSSKIQAFSSLMTRLEAKPTIVFTAFRGEYDAATAALRSAGYRVWGINGSMSASDREHSLRLAAESVRDGHAATAMVVNIVTGNAGLNMQFMSRIVFLSTHWNPSVMDQAVARAYRIGQTERVEVHHILLSDEADKNLDRYIVNMHSHKRSIAKAVHEKLVCESAVDEDHVLSVLDDAL